MKSMKKWDGMVGIGMIKVLVCEECIIYFGEWGKGLNELGVGF